MKLAYPEPATGGRLVTLHCRPPPSKTDCLRRMSASEVLR
ncbi:MAG: hypothetical protein IPH54_15930 [Rhodoferax sp.]|nr:hypothetical protein [Rhodoferax sp.]